jgi:hypothetical protein
LAAIHNANIIESDDRLVCDEQKMFGAMTTTNDSKTLAAREEIRRRHNACA